MPSSSAGEQSTDLEEGRYSSQEVLEVIDSVKEKVVAERFADIKKRIVENRQKVSNISNHVYDLSNSRRNTTLDSSSMDADLLTRRQEDAVCTLSSLELCGGEKDPTSCQEESSYGSTLLLGNNFVGKSGRPIKLPEVQKLPPYTTWTFLDRNQRMAEDQSVVGRRRIYYDRNGGEALICSDSEEEAIEDEEEKREFRQAEDVILRMTIEEAGMSDFVLDSLAMCLDRKPSDIKARYEAFVKSETTDECVEKGTSEAIVDDTVLDKDLDAALDSFDNLFCRRCLVFDCRLHGCSQDLVFPAEKHHPWSNSDEGAPCGIHCYKMAMKQDKNATVSSQMPRVYEELAQSSGSVEESLFTKKKSTRGYVGKRGKSHESESASSNARVISESSESEVRPSEDIVCIPLSSSPSKPKRSGKLENLKRNNKRVAEQDLVCINKKQIKMVTSDSDSIVGGRLMKLRSNTRSDSKDAVLTSQNRAIGSAAARQSKKKGSTLEDNFSSADVDIQNESNGEMVKELATKVGDIHLRKEIVVESRCKRETTSVKNWRVLEKSLFDKGLQIFGKKSCLIARNLLSGMKTCSEVAQYMNFLENKGTYGGIDGSNSLIDGPNQGSELRTRSRFLRRRGRVRRLKYSGKSAGYHSIRKRITDKKDQPCRQYNPCGCQSACGKQCPCLLNETCCEKYCGCPKTCKNRFRGCHCAKSQCRSRQCPCFAANRECDPDVCRNCWISCGDGSLGVPSQRGDNYECRNMKLLLKQQQRVLLGRSDISGWGAFLKNSVNKHDYLGEYTGELISHREADKRGKIYDRENSSFLFNLNDQFVLDAYRKGDKLKFANHSPDPNCYAKVMMVAGDHRVGIFAKERIGAGEEIFYDYRYEADRAPVWARKPEASGSKKDDTGPSSGRAKKLA